MSYRTPLARALFSLTVLACATAHAADDKPVRIRGEIVAATADGLTVKHVSGEQVKIAAPPDTAVSSVKNVPLSSIKSGDYVGAASRKGPDGKQTAIEVLVFPEAARGSGEGHYGWDLAPDSSMTNANVDAVVSGTDGRDLKLSYKGGTQTIVVPTNAPVVTFAPATRADVLPGKKVFVVAKPTGDGYLAQRIVVEKDGVAPPM